MIIRQVQRKDNALSAAMIREVFDEYDAPKVGSVYSDKATDRLYEIFQDEKAVLWVDQSEGKILGSCGIFPTEGLPAGCAELVKFYISAEARGKGIGKVLMGQSIESAKELGYNEIYIESFPEFANAVSIYQKLGFRNLNEPLGNSGHTACTIWMIKRLAKLVGD
jgi:putative acetyltransferase